MPISLTANRIGLRRWCSVTLAIALVVPLAAACTKRSPAPLGTTTHVVPIGATAPVDATAWALADQLTQPAYTAGTTAAMVAGLARAGIGTFADPATSKPDQPVSGPANPMRLLDFQAHALAVEAWAGAGFTGAELDTVLPLPAGVVGLPTTSQVLAGYVGAANTPGGALSRALMAGQNLRAPTTLRFPGLVLMFFAADMATDIATVAGPGHSGTAVPASLLLVDPGICSTATNWVEQTIVGFFAALRQPVPANLPGAIIVSIWNWLVDAGEAFVHDLIKAASDAVLGTIRIMAAGLSAAAMQIASLLPYAIKVVATGDNGGGATFTLGADPQPGHFTASVTAGDLPDWPAPLADCATVAKVALPDFHSKTIPLIWEPLETPPGPLITPTDSTHINDTTDANGQASWGFVASKDPGDPNAEQRSQVIGQPVAVHRPELDEARTRLTNALLGYIPGLLRPFVTELFAPYLDGLQNRLNKILDARGRGLAYLIYHDGTAPTPKPSPPAATGTCTATPVRPGNYTGTNTNAFDENQPMTGGAMVYHNTATGPVHLTVAANGALSGTWSFQMNDVMDENMEISGISAHYHSERIWEMTAGTITGTVCNLGLTSSAVNQTSCTGTCGDSAAQPAPAGAQPALGPPISATPGHITWQLKRNADDGSYTDTFTITVNGPA